MAVVAGFQNEISYKVTGLTADLTVRAYVPGNSYEIIPVDYDSELVQKLSSIKGVGAVQQYVVTEGIMQNAEGMQGVMVKGVGADYDWSFVRDHLTQGSIPVFADTTRSREIIISRLMANQLTAAEGDIVNIISVGDNVRRDRFRISGIYDSGIEEFDSQLVFAHVNTIRRVQQWYETTVDGYEIRIADQSNSGRITSEVTHVASSAGDYDTSTVRQRYRQIYDWLDMLDINTALVIILMFIVAGVNMICAILIIVLDSTRMIGVLTSQGMRRWSIQKIFIYRSMYITLIGMLTGNLFGIGISLVQQFWAPIKLDASSYMVSTVPVFLQWSNVLILDIAIFAGITLLVMLPTMIISSITPEKSIRFQ